MALLFIRVVPIFTLICCCIGALLFPYVEMTGSVVSSNKFVMLHVCLVVLGCACLILSSVVGIGLLLKEFLLQRRKFFSILYYLPVMTLLDKIHYLFVYCGLIFSISGVCVGLWLSIRSGFYLTVFDKNVFNTMTAFSIYIVVVLSHIFYGQRGANIAWLSLVGGAMLVASLLLVKPLGDSFHVY